MPTLQWRDPRTVGSCLIAGFFASAAFYFAATTLCAMINFGWRQPMFDQWAEYETFLNLPFPQNVLQAANGHRPILPNLIRVAEIRWFAGDQVLQLCIGGFAALALCAIMTLSAWRQRDLPRPERWAAVMLAVLGVLWLANARRLLHGSEALHGYVPTLAAACAAYSTWNAAQRHSVRDLWIAAAFCFAATFSFGLGLASFCAVLGVCVLLRLPWRWFAIPLAIFILSLVLYVYVLPGDQGVRSQLDPQPIETLRQTARWIAAPWMNGWLSATDSITPPWLDLSTQLGQGLSVIAKALSEGTGIGGETLSTLIGLAGIAAFCAIAAWTYFWRIKTSRLAALAFGCGLFALGSGIITVISRLDYLKEHPEQIYADRYMLWPSLFWASLAMLWLAPAARARGFTRAATLAFLFALPIVLSATQHTGAIWAAITYRLAQSNAAAVESGVYDEAHFPGVDLGRERTLREVALLRQRRIAMFADGAWQRVGTRFTGPLQAATDAAVQAHWLDPVADPTAQKSAAHFEGFATKGARSVQKYGKLAVLDDAATIAGLAEWSVIGPNAPALVLRVPRKRGFDGYVRDYDPQRSYTVVALDLKMNTGIVLATLPARDATR